jgi:hypothetical protein
MRYEKGQLENFYQMGQDNMLTAIFFFFSLSSLDEAREIAFFADDCVHSLEQLSRT